MAITYTYVINNMSVVQNPDPNTVIMVNFTINGTDGTNTGQVTYSINLPLPTGSDFVPYADLTQDIVIGWVQATLGTGNIATQASMEKEVADQIAKQSIPAPQQEPLPWVEATTLPAEVVPAPIV